MEKYIITDLIMESAFMRQNKIVGNNDTYSERNYGEICVCKLNVTTQEQKNEYGCDMGRYVTIFAPKISKDHSCYDTLLDLTATELKHLVSFYLSKASAKMTILIAGLGNRRIVSDAVGPLTVDRLSVTRHVKLVDPQDFENMHCPTVSVVECGVLGKTGIESSECVRATAKEIGADLVIAIDSLAAKETGRLMSVIQMTDRGIMPGAGIGNRRSALNKKTVGIPVIAIGVPTVISTSTVIACALSECGYDKLSEKITERLDIGKQLFVSPKECDLAVDEVSELLAKAIDKALLGI
jgi:spore protease